MHDDGWGVVVLRVINQVLAFLFSPSNSKVRWQVARSTGLPVLLKAGCDAAKAGDFAVSGHFLLAC
jgi:hypothetical protein